jgi:hypothetical protein
LYNFYICSSSIEDIPVGKSRVTSSRIAEYAPVATSPDMEETYSSLSGDVYYVKDVIHFRGLSLRDNSLRRM